MIYLRPKLVGNFKPEKAPRPRQKRKREGNSSSHLDLIRKCPCAIPDCNDLAIQAHHLKATGERGAAMRSPDRFAVPLCVDHHLHGVELVGSKNELGWFKERGVNALQLAADLWVARGNLRRMRSVTLEHRMRAED